ALHCSTCWTRSRGSSEREAELSQSSLRANGSRECAPDDRLREAIQLSSRIDGLLRRFAPRKDGGGSDAYSTKITLTSLTLVSVGPVSSRSPVLAKNAVASLFSRYALGSRPSDFIFANVAWSIIAPAGSLALPAPPSAPSVSSARAEMPG